jgi:succinyl-CoA synthetase alpha subunit
MDAWQKDEETRNDIIAFGEKEKQEDADEMKRLTDMDGVVALIAGMTQKEGSS